MKISSKLLLTAVISSLVHLPAHAATDDDKRISELEKKVDALTEMVESQPQNTSSSTLHKVHLGGYGELKYHNLNVDGEDEQNFDFHRFVLFVGYDFTSDIRLVSEIELEHTVSSASKAGEVELEQAYLEFDLDEAKSMHLKTGIILMPVGLINENHEPPTFYGVDRPIVETTIIPSTWWAAGAMFTQQMSSGISYDLFLSEGLKTQDPTVDANNDPYNIKGGKQKTTSPAGEGGAADAYDLAMTGRIKYTGTPGLEIAASLQYQPDLDQSAKDSYADSATLVSTHLVYQFSDFTFKGLYANWFLAGDGAKDAGRDNQWGAYAELDYKPFEKFGFFVRQSQWSEEKGVDNTQTDFGMNYWPIEDIVFKVDVVNQTQDNIDTNGFNLGMGFQF